MVSASGLPAPLMRQSSDVDPATGETVVRYASRTPGPEDQVVYEQWIFERFAPDGYLHAMARH